MRPVIFVQQSGKKSVQCSLRNTNHQDDRKARTIKLDARAPHFEEMKSCEQGRGSIEQAGTNLYAALCKNPAIREFLTTVLSRFAQDKYPIYFSIDPNEIDALPWEALKRPGEPGFVALDERFAVAREEETTSGTIREEYGFFYPAKFMAVLSATNETAGEVTPSAAEQWEALYAVLCNARDLLIARWGLEDAEPLEVLILTNDGDLHEVLADTPDWIEAGWIESANQIIARRAAFQPHLLHFFCHGLAVSDPPQLILGTYDEFVAGYPGSIRLSPQQLAERQPNTWLLTLSSCSTAASETSVQNFARQVARQGTAFVVGMREAIDTRHARVISEHFYPHVFEALSGLREGIAEDVDWSFALNALRSELHRVSHPDHAHSDCFHWTIPVLYRRAGPFTIKRLKLARSERLVRDRTKLEELRRQDQLLTPIAGDRFAAKLHRRIANLERRVGERRE
jgi:CHAT domain